MQDLKDMYDRAKMGLFAKKGAMFISTLYFSLKMSWDESIPTACTDGHVLKINPQFFQKISKEMRPTLLAHEAWHVGLLHPLRRGNRDPEKWNAACDYAINIMLKDLGYHFDPNLGLIDDKYRGQTAEQIYDQLPDGPGDGSGFSNMGGMGSDLSSPQGNGPKDPSQPDKPGPRMSGLSEQEIENQIIATLVKATMASKMSGKEAGVIPGDLEAYLDAMLNPKLAWETILENHMNDLIKDDYSWSRPNRRFLPEYYLPSQFGDGLSRINWYLDISGSITDNQGTRFNSEVRHVHERFTPKETNIISFDTRIQDEYRFTDDERYTGLEFHGRGGTDLDCVFEHARANPPDLMIVFSDLHCRRITEEPPFPVIWICADNPNGTVEFGRLIHMDTDE
ncbi:vWA domain-containing protein [Pantoea eucrina]|uniref:vWA domain-containing protein n=1 Tax=Pantoea eucrina TaxID=472693 RepID=UPI00080F4318|nr:VWA-like domain-containing protein [Pantoea eucrina]